MHPLRNLFAWSGIICLLLVTNANAIPYSFTKVADNSGTFATGGFARPYLNDVGTVAFKGDLNNGTSGIYVGNGGALGTVATTVGTFNILSTGLSINNSGTVAFAAKLDVPGAGIFIGKAATVPTPAVSGGTFSNSGFDDVRINDAGTLAFRATNSNKGVWTGAGSTYTLVALEGAGGFLEVTDPISLTSTGTVVFFAATAPSVGGIYSNEGGTAHEVVGAPSYLFPRGGAMNDSGAMVFSGITPGQLGLYVRKNNIDTPIATSQGPISSFDEMGINAAGAVAVYMELDSGDFGIFNGPDLVANNIIRKGDALFGGTVSDLFYNDGGAINDAGQVAFSYILTNGQQGVALATPLPEPASAGVLFAAAFAVARRRIS